VTGTYLYLTVTSLKNRVLRRVRRLREPRYLAGLVVGLLYLYWFVVRNQMRGARRAGDGLARLSPFAPDVMAAGALALWGLALLAWLWPRVGRAWTFSGAEIQFFFTAPVSRRQLLNYKLLRSQLGLLFGVLIASLFTGAARAAMAGRWSYVLGGWLLFATMLLHVLGANLTK
jgi:ABC-2 type transport system permease protein